MQENEHKLQQAEGGAENISDTTKKTLEESPISEPKPSDNAVPEQIENTTPKDRPEETGDAEAEKVVSQEASNTSDESAAEQTEDTKSEDNTPPDSEDSNEAIDEIDADNAEDAEDSDNEKRHFIPMLDYHSMSMENLVGELQRLVRNEKIQAIGKHVSSIKYEFDQKFQEFLEHKKEEFVSKGGNEVDFKYNSVAKRQFNEVYSDYREKRDHYYKQLEQTLKDNLQKRLDIIEQLKGLIDVEEDINTTYKNFKDLQENWKNAGPVPRTSYNDVWRTYHHHMEIFYDFLHLNRELRDLDFKHNLEEKLKLVERAEGLVNEPDLTKAFRELQTLHKIWKEDIGPVAKEQREEVWERFSNATKAMHQRRQEHFQELETVYEKNLEKKQEIIGKIASIAENVTENHRALQQQIKEVEALRDSFFKAGKVPQRVNEETWNAFKEAVRKFNRNKNAFYKNQKKEQHQNLEKKRALLELATSLKDSDDWSAATPEMKRIQSEWKKIGHVPRKYSDKIWNEFKNACNHYFNRLHAEKNESHKEEYENLDKKMACLDRLRDFQLSGDREKDLETLKKFLAEWKEYGRIPYNKKHINGKFNKITDALFNKLGIGKQQTELLKYGNKVQELAKTEDNRAIGNERVFIRRKIDESKSEIRQLENNLQFFSGDSEDNPLVKQVVDNLNKQKDALQTWKEKLKKLNILENKLNREAEEEENSPEEE